MIASSLLLLGFFAVGLAVPVIYHDCGSKSGRILAVDIEPCDNPSLCTLKKGTTPVVTVALTTGKSISSVHAKVTGTLPGNIQSDFPLPNSDGCKSGLSCPMASGTTAKYSQGIDILSSYPSWKVIVEWELVDQDSQDLICFVAPVQISD